MTLNMTFVVQLLNFLVTWCIIRYFFVHPAIKLRDRIKGSLHTLLAESDTLQNAIENTREQEYRSWHVWYLHAQKIMKDRYQPIQSREPVSVRVVAPEVPSYEIEKLVKQLTLLVVKRVQGLP